jgi:uncharacterized protein YbjT (DUF2867 family)
MVVFLTGASGFIGRHLAAALAQTGHTLVLGLHNASTPVAHCRVIAIDYLQDVDASAWRPRLQGVDVVVNAVGVLRATAGAGFDALHVNAPRALFEASAQVGVRRVIQISALGADDDAQSAYHLSKREADRFLATLPVASVIVQPSLVYGTGGTSARLFDTLASMPLIPVPGKGDQRVQPIHVDDAVAALVALVERDEPSSGERISLVGPEALTLVAFLRRLRSALGFRATRVLRIPMSIMRAVAAAGARLPGALLDPETLAMLERGNVASDAKTRELLGRAPRPVEAFVTPDAAAAASASATLAWILPLMRGAIAIVWIWTGIVSLGLYPPAESYALLARLGATGMVATVLLYGAALVDVLLGIGVFVLRDRRWLWPAQIAVMVAYSVLISVWLPEWWLHPYGPMIKNLPLLVATMLVAALESRRWTT